MMVFISIFASITSCSNEDTLESIFPTEIKVHKDTFKFRYQGVEYIADYELKDSTMLFTDSTINNLLTKLNQNPNTSTLTYPNGVVEYFDSNQDLEDFLKRGNAINRSEMLNTLYFSAITSITLKVYEHAKFEGEVITYNGYTEVSNMKNAYNAGIPNVPKNFNDIISSFQLNATRQQVIKTEGKRLSAVLIFYQDANFKGSSKAFILDMQHSQITLENFKSINFNDKISSFKLYGTSVPYPTI